MKVWQCLINIEFKHLGSNIKNNEKEINFEVLA